MKTLFHSSWAICLLAIIGCTYNRPHRTFLPITSADDVRRAAARPADAPEIKQPNADAIETWNVEGTDRNFKIGYVEFDDQGWFWSHRQWEKVRTALTNQVSATNSRPVTLLVFAHGWKNNADFDNENVKLFRHVLTNLSLSLSNRQVFGIYMGWRGQSTKWDWFPPLGEELSFYGRKATAERVGHQGAATQVLTELQIIQDRHNGVTNANASTTNTNHMQMVVIGHSFGADVIFTAISQVLTERLLWTTTYRGNNEPPKPIKSFGDLVILLSPAFEGALYNNLVSIATGDDIEYAADQKPVLAVFTSKTDVATHYAFPLGRFFSGLFQQTRPSTGAAETNLFNITKNETAHQWRATHETIGWDPDYVTWDLNYKNWSSEHAGRYPRKATSPGTTGLLPYVDTTPTTASENVPTNSGPFNAFYFNNYSVTNAKPGTPASTNYYACILQPRPKNRYAERLARAHNLLVNAQVDKAIMDGHGDIANPNLIRFLEDFIGYNLTANPASVPTNEPPNAKL